MCIYFELHHKFNSNKVEFTFTYTYSSKYVKIVLGLILIEIL